MKFIKAGLFFIFLTLCFFLSVWPQGRTQMIIKDNLGRSVKIERKIERIVCLQPELLRILVALGQKNRVVAIDRFPVRYDHLMPIIFPDVERLPVVSVTGEDANLERILSLKPDLVLVSPSELYLSHHLARKLKCPVISLSSIGRLDRLLEEVEILARITDSEQRGSELKKLIQDKLGLIKKRLAELSESSPPKVYLGFWGSLLRSPVFYEPVELAGGHNLAGQLKPIYEGSDTAVLNIEFLLKSNPDFILIQGNYLPVERSLTIEEVLSDPKLQTIRAVKDKKVFYTFGFWYWWDPALVLVECLYLSWLFHPDLMSDLDLMAEAENIFKNFYGREGLFKRLCDKIEAYDWFKKK